MWTYLARCVVVVVMTWLCIRLIGKKSITQMTSYDLAVVIVLANVTAEPLVYKNISKQLIGALAITGVAISVGWLSLQKWFYNADARPGLVIINGHIDRRQLKANRVNLPFLLSLLREKGFARISDVEFAVIEPNGNLSVIPKSQSRPVTPKDLNIPTQYEGLALPLILDGELQSNNLQYVGVDESWLLGQLQKRGISGVEQVLLAELDTIGNLYVDPIREEHAKPALI